MESDDNRWEEHRYDLDPPASSDNEEAPESLGSLLRRIRDLEGQLHATQWVNYDSWEETTGSYHRDGPIIHPGYNVLEPDEERRASAATALNLIKNKPDQRSIVLYAASKALGEKVKSNPTYSLRIFMHQHPVKSTLRFATVLGLGYVLHEYLSK